MVRVAWKDYRLRGGGADAAADITGEAFAGAISEQEWYSCKIDRSALKQLIKRSDGKALVSLGAWLFLLMAAGVAGYFTWGTVWAVPCFALYSVLYAAADHRHHELSHGTPFRTRWLNEIFYHVCAFMTLREGFYYRWSHSRHHTHTVIVGKDPELIPRTAPICALLLELPFIRSLYHTILRMASAARGRIDPNGLQFIPATQIFKVIWASRVYLLVMLLTIIACVATKSILPAMYIVLPRTYGGILAQIFNITQHAGLAEDVYDHRLNTRTIVMNPVFTFLYGNMNYHLEHHMFPMVPFYNLPRLHELIKAQCPPPYSTWEAVREVIYAIRRQQADPAFHIERKLPTGA